MSSPKSKNNYRELTDKLDSIVNELQQENIDIDEALTKFEKANELILKIEEYLSESENKIKKIKQNK